VPVTADNPFLLAGLPMPLVQRLAVEGIDTPFPIQEATLPDALSGRDVLGRGQTGSGKTLAFGLPMIARLMEADKAAARRPLAIVLVPTRELAIQVNRALEPLARSAGRKIQLVAGGLSYQPQIAALERGVDVLIATPGRLVDLMEKGAADLSEVRIAVLDEADHMAEMGFVPEVTAILDAIPSGGQRLLFSATLDRGIDQIVATYLRDPVTHSTDGVTAAVTTMEHHILWVEPQHKKQITAEVANRGGRTLVFARTKLGAERVAEQLRGQGVFAAALHGGLNQGVRGRILTAFTEGTLPVLVATDVAARGIHVDGIGLVLQIDPPADHKDYLHRAGRTARAGDRGIVATLALPHQQKLMARLARDAGVEAAGVAVAPGDPVLVERTGARRPQQPPITAEQLRRIVEADRRRPGVRGQRRPAPRGRPTRG
jgi:superfamily II DNA/RNA helicase